MQHAVSRNWETFRGLVAAGIQLELHDRHRRNRRQIVRIEHAQERVRQLGEFVVDLVAYAPSQQSERFNEPFDVRIGAFIVLKLQTARRAGIALGKIARHLPDEQQFALVMAV